MNALPNDSVIVTIKVLKQDQGDQMKVRNGYRSKIALKRSLESFSERECRRDRGHALCP